MCFCHGFYFRNTMRWNNQLSASQRYIMHPVFSWQTTSLVTKCCPWPPKNLENCSISGQGNTRQPWGLHVASGNFTQLSPFSFELTSPTFNEAPANSSRLQSRNLKKWVMIVIDKENCGYRLTVGASLAPLCMSAFMSHIWYESLGTFLFLREYSLVSPGSLRVHWLPPERWQHGPRRPSQRTLRLHPQHSGHRHWAE